MTQNEQNFGLDGLVTSEGIEIPHGENLLGFDSSDVVNSGGGWLSIANRSGKSIFLHTIPGLILLSFEDLDGTDIVVGEIPEELSTIHRPFLDSVKNRQPSAISTPLISTECPSKNLEKSSDSKSSASRKRDKAKSNGTPTADAT